MINFILIIFCLGAGLLIARLRILPRHSYKSINTWILYIAMPALSLRYVPYIEWNLHVLLPCLAPVVVWVGAWLMVSLYAAKYKIDQGTRTALLITMGLSNTAFLGFPLIAAYYGEESISYAIVFDQVTFILFSTLAVLAVMKAVNSKQQRIGILPIVTKVIKFPPFIACLCALVIPCFIDISFINPLLDKLVATLSPLALFSIGLQLRLNDWRKEVRHLSFGLGYKLLLAPLLIWGLAWGLNVHNDLGRISVFEAAMPTHITASLLASQYNLNPRLCNLMVGVGIIIGFGTTALWWLFMDYLW